MIRPRAPHALLLILAGLGLAADAPPTPEQHLGFRPGADGHLAGWETIVDYYRKVDAASDRVLVRELGTTTEGRPYLVAFVSAPETIADLDRYRDMQRRIADPRRIPDKDEADRLVAESKPVVLITCTIHSTETASTLMSTELLHDLATKDDSATKEILEHAILILVPSANPDGVDKVAAWYEKTKGTPYEGSGLPELYHKYAGHDTNRDWFMLNLKETQLLTRLLYREWFPTLSYDVHQMGSRGARLFVPPFYEPLNPNLDPRVSQGIFLIGSHMAAELANAGKKGVLTHAMYDNWWNGGMRTTPQRHNIVGVLTEAASVKLATPIFLEKSELRGATRGFPDHRPAVNFVDPWPGGWWRLRDIVDYELICARSLLTLAARYRSMWQRNYLEMGQAAVAAGRDAPPYGWVVPLDGRDPGTATELVRILRETGVEVHRAKAPFKAGGIEFAAGAFVLPAAQPYRAHLKDMMERQVYPDRFTAGGAAEPPYDVAGWTLPLQMGVRSVALAEPIGVETEAVDVVEPLKGRIEGPDDADYFVIANTANDDFVVAGELIRAGVEVERVREPLSVPRPIGPGALRFRASPEARKVLDAVLPAASTRVEGVKGSPIVARTERLKAPRVGLYQPWVPSMDEGWTRLVFEKFRIPYTTLHNADVASGALRDRFDAIVVPSIGAATLRDGYKPDESAPQYVGGLGRDGVDALRQFVAAGGVLVFLNDSCDFAIEALGLPVKNVVKGLRTSEFYGPGTILRVEAAVPLSGLNLGVPPALSAYFSESAAFEVATGGEGKGVASLPVTYAKTGVLESGWLLGPEKIQGKGAVALVEGLGGGKVVLFGFPPQHRGQPHGTFRLLFNSLFLGAD